MATLYPVVRVVDSDGAPVTGDAANLTLTVITDGVAAAYAGTVTEVASGRYALVVTEAGVLQEVSGVSSTPGAIVVPACWDNRLGSSGVQLICGNVNPIGSRFALGIVRGDDNPFSLTLKDGDGTAINLTGSTVTLVAKAADELAAATLWTWTGAISSPQTAGIVTFSPAASDTTAAAVEEGVKYPAYISIVIGGKVQTLLGTVEVGGKYVGEGDGTASTQRRREGAESAETATARVGEGYGG